MKRMWAIWDTESNNYLQTNNNTIVFHNELDAIVFCRSMKLKYTGQHYVLSVYRPTIWYKMLV